MGLWPKANSHLFPATNVEALGRRGQGRDREANAGTGRIRGKKRHFKIQEDIQSREIDQWTGSGRGEGI